MDLDRPERRISAWPQLIALHAADHGGKNTTAKVIDRVCQQLDLCPDSWVRYTERAFATYMKQSIAASFGLDPHDVDAATEFVDKLKQPGVKVQIVTPNGSVFSTPGRQYIRDMATKGHRELFGANFWVDLLIPEGHFNHAKFNHAAMCVITDLRFNSEAQRVREVGGKVWSIIGRGDPIDEDHLSNGDFQWRESDAIIDNSGSVSNLYQEVARIIVETHLV